LLTESANPDRRRRIVHISTLHPAMDSRIFYREARTVSDLGYDVTVFGVRDEDAVVDGVRVRRLGAPKRRWVRLLTSAARGLAVVWRTPADLYQFHDPELLPAALAARLVLRKRVVFDAHEDVALLMTKPWIPGPLRRPITWLMGKFDWFCARTLDGIVTTSEEQNEGYSRYARRAVRFLNFPAPRFLEQRDAAWRPYAERGQEVVHLGTLSTPRLEFLVRMAGEFLRDHPQWRWTFVGLFPEQEAWFREHVHGDVAPRLRGLGKVHHMEVAAILCGAAIGVNFHPVGAPHLQRVIPLKVFEYLACGLPTVTTRVRALVNLVKDCPAVTFADEDAAAYGATLKALAARSDRAALSEQARQFSDERFNCRREGEQLAAMYEAIWRGEPGLSAPLRQ